MIFKNKKYITFDCYGTLIDWEGSLHSVFQKYADNKNIKLNMDGLTQRYIKIEYEIEQEQYRKYKEVLKIATKRLFKEEGFEISDENTDILVNSIHKWPPFNETRQILSTLKNKGYKLMILSNIDEDIISESIKLIGINFDGIITAEKVKSYKPAYKHWQEMLKQFNAVKEEVIHVAASYIHDIIPAKEQSFNTIWINRNNEKITAAIKPDLELTNLNFLPNYL